MLWPSQCSPFASSPVALATIVPVCWPEGFDDCTPNPRIMDFSSQMAGILSGAASVDGCVALSQLDRRRIQDQESLPVGLGVARTCGGSSLAHLCVGRWVSPL